MREGIRAQPAGADRQAEPPGVMAPVQADRAGNGHVSRRAEQVPDDRHPGDVVARRALTEVVAGPPRRSEPGHLVVPRMGLEFPRQLPFEAWLVVGSQLAAAASSAWCLGDWLAYGQAACAGRYRDAVELTGLDYQTLRNYAWVAGRFELSRRRDTLSFGHHAGVALCSRLARGGHVAIHCRHGIGRSCPLPAMVMVLEETEPGEAWELIAAARGLAVPDTPAQRDFILSLSAAMLPPHDC